MADNASDSDSSKRHSKRASKKTTKRTRRNSSSSEEENDRVAVSRNKYDKLKERLTTLEERFKTVNTVNTANTVNDVYILFIIAIFVLLVMVFHLMLHQSTMLLCPVICENYFVIVLSFVLSCSVCGIARFVYVWWTKSTEKS